MIALTVSAKGDVMFPSVGRLGGLPQRLPHQTTEHLPGTDAHKTRTGTHVGAHACMRTHTHTHTLW